MSSLSKVRAANSLSRLLSEEISAQEAKKLNPWLSIDKDYRDEMLGEFHLLADLDSLADDPELLSLVDGIVASPPTSNTLKWKVFATAASILLLSVITFLFVAKPSFENDAEVLRYVTRVGEIKTITLNDGSIVNMNTGTEILVNIDKTLRRVILLRGEAFFDVIKDNNRSFTVETGVRSVTAIGTEFNILKSPNRLQVAVLEGLVAVHPTEEPASKNAQKLSKTEQNQSKQLNLLNQVNVQAGWFVDLDEETQSFSGYQPKDINAMLSWKRGILEFNRLELTRIIRTLNRYSNKKILMEVEDNNIMNLKVSLMVNIKELDLALKGLERSLPIKVTHYFDRIIITEKK